MNNDDLYASEPKANEKQVTLAFRLSESTREEFKKLCDSRNVDMSVVLKRFIERELKASKAA